MNFYDDVIPDPDGDVEPSGQACPECGSDYVVPGIILSSNMPIGRCHSCGECGADWDVDYDMSRRHEPPTPAEIRRGKMRRKLEAKLEELELERELRDWE